MSNATFSSNQTTAKPGVTDQVKSATDRVGADTSSMANEAKATVNELGDRAKQGVHDAAEHVRGLAEDQKAAGADRIKGYAGSINRAADSLEGDMPMVADFARKAAGEIAHLADAVKDRDLVDLVGVVQDYARRQPALFLGATALAGFMAVRFLSASAEKRSREVNAGEWKSDSDHVGTPRPLPARSTQG